MGEMQESTGKSSRELRNGKHRKKCRRGKLKKNETNSKKKKKIKKIKKPSQRLLSVFKNPQENLGTLNFLMGSDDNKNKGKRRRTSVRTTAPKENDKSAKKKRKKKKSSKKKGVLGKRKQPKEKLTTDKEQPKRSSGLKQVKIETLFKTQKQFEDVDLATATPEIVFFKLVHFQKNFGSNSAKDRNIVLEDLFKTLDSGITRMSQQLQQMLKNQVSFNCRARFTQMFRNCLFLRSMSPFTRRSLWSEVYRPTRYEHLFSNNQMLQIEEHLHSFFYQNAQNGSNSLVAQSQLKTTSKTNPFFASLQQNSKSGLRFLSQRSQTNYFDGDSLVRQNLLLLLGPRSSGKFTNLKVFARKCNYELEVIDFALQNKVLSIKRKYLHAVGTNDVKVNLLDQFRKQRTKASRKVRESSSHSLEEYFKRSRPAQPRRSDDSQLQKLLKRHTKRKIFVCKNLDFLFDFNRSENKRRFRKNFGEFLMFIRRSKYPFVFTSCDERKCFRMFGRSLDSIKVVQLAPPSTEEVVQFLFIIVFIERMFRVFKADQSPRHASCFFQMDSRGHLALIDSQNSFSRHVPDVRRVGEFVEHSRPNLSWVLEKAFLFRNSFFDSKISRLQVMQLEVNKRISVLSNVAAVFPRKDAFLKKSWLEETLDKLLTNKTASQAGRNQILRHRLYAHLPPTKKKRKKPRSKLTSLHFLNPCLPFLTRRKTDASEWLNLFRNSLNLQILTDNARLNLSRQEEHLDHLRKSTQPDLTRFSEPCLEFKNLWPSKKSARRPFNKVKGYYCNFEKDHSELEKLEAQIRTYNRMFRRQAPLAFLQSNQLRFSVAEIDMFKQVRYALGNHSGTKSTSHDRLKTDPGRDCN